MNNLDGAMIPMSPKIPNQSMRAHNCCTRGFMGSTPPSQLRQTALGSGIQGGAWQLDEFKEQMFTEFGLGSAFSDLVRQVIR